MALQVIHSTQEMQQASDQLHLSRKKIALVPTMGYLHAGHVSLFKLARAHADIVAATIFVNPTQFGPNEDYNRYPRDFEHDRFLAGEAGVDIVFAPSDGEMYAPGYASYVEVEHVSKIFEGAFRPTHFRGVTTIVAKFFNIVRPQTALFGQKDAQQAFLLKKMTHDLNFNIEILVAPIIRETDGLAMSSRNAYLSKTERQQALVLSQSLFHAQKRITEGERNCNLIVNEMKNIILSGRPSQID
ncbi:MAG: pantoate--beta-alanine ligase, partial [Bacteroidota bacterium]